MRFFLSFAAASLLTGAALAGTTDLAAFGSSGQTAIKTTTSSSTQVTNAAVETPTANTSGKDSTSVLLNANTAGVESDATSGGVTNDLPKVEEPAMPMPGGNPGISAPLAPNTMPTPTTTTTKYIYKGEKNVDVPPLMVKDPRVNDGYVQEMFGRNKNK